MRSQKDLKAIIENEDCDLEIYCAPRTRKEKAWNLIFVAMGLLLMGLMVYLPRWEWRLACAFAYWILSITFDHLTRLR